MASGNLQTADFYYQLPQQLIARYPPAHREDSRLLWLDPERNARRDCRFAMLPQLLRPGDLLVFNDSRVIPARLFGHKPTGGRVELLIERILEPQLALVRVRCRRPLREGGTIHLDAGTSPAPAPAPTLHAERRQGEFWILRLTDQGMAYAGLLERWGRIPLPPYLGRADEPLDRERYQTVYARRPGAVAAPTAGLHFTQALLGQLRQHDIQLAWLTLHTGSGTFQPIRTATVEEHTMHEEWMELDAELCTRLAAARRAGGRVIAVGTTSLRALESAALLGLTPRQCMTRLYIRPGYRFRIVDGLITNFHLPGSSLLVLAAAFAGYESLMQAYQHAIRNEYRFYSYGDAMLMHRQGG